MAIVYEHYRKDTNQIFYVGIGKNVSRSKSKSCRNDYWHHIVNKCGYDIIITHKKLTWDDACVIECQKIKEYGRADLGLGPLVNMTDGGEGVENVSPESRKKISEKMVGENNHRYGKFGHETYNAKLTDKEVKFIRDNFKPFSPEFGIRALSRMFSVDRNTIKKIATGESYRSKDTERKELIDTTTNNKFSIEDIKFIRNNYIPHDPVFGCKPLSIKFNTNESRIWKIVNKKVWKDI